MTKSFVKTLNAPPAAGPYSQGITVGNLLFVAAQGSFDPRTDKLVGRDVESQTRQTLENIRAIVDASGFAMPDIVRVSVFLKRRRDFKRMNEVYKTFFPENPPTRTTVVAGFVIPGMLLEMNAIACRED